MQSSNGHPKLQGVSAEAAHNAIEEACDIDAALSLDTRMPDSTPLTIARAFRRDCYELADGLTLLRKWNGEWFAYQQRAGAYVDKPKDQLRAELYEFIEPLWVETEDGNVPIVANRRRVDDVLDALGALCQVPATQMPTWLGDARSRPSDLIAFRNGLVSTTQYLDAGHVTLLPPSPLWFSTNVLPFDFSARVPQPAAWLEFLNTIFEDPAERELLAQWFGYCLTPDTSLHKILFLIGPPRAGKGVIARVLTAMLGAANVCAPTLGGLASHFGLWGLIGKLLAIISDARLSGRTDSAVVTERLLTISGEDSVMIDRKNMAPVTLRLPTRIMILSNELPKLDDSSGAMAERFIILNLTKSFLGKEDTGLTERLIGELPGILLWAMDGLRLLHSRGKFVPPASSSEVIDELRDLVSPIRAFIRDACNVAPGQTVEVEKLFEAWGVWCEEAGRGRAGTIQLFGRDLRAALPAVKVTKPRDGEKRTRCYEGITLKLSFAEHVSVKVNAKKAGWAAMGRGPTDSTSRETSYP